MSPIWNPYTIDVRIWEIGDDLSFLFDVLPDHFCVDVWNSWDFGYACDFRNLHQRLTLRQDVLQKLQ